MIYRFEEFELDPQLRELRKDGAAIDVEPQVFDLLLYLIDNAEHVVGKDELFEHVWAGRIVSDSTLSSRINAARRVLNDDGSQQRLIRTVPRRGFRFVGVLLQNNVAKPLSHRDGNTDKAKAAQATGNQKVRMCKSSDGTRLAYATTGVGYPMVRAGHFLTHLEHDWHDPIWRPFIQKLGQSFSVTRYDQRGCGLSDWSSTDFALDKFVEDLSAIVEAAELDKFALYGTSQGGPIAIEYAARNPDRVTHLILHGSYAEGRFLRDSEADREQGEALLTLMRHGWGQEDSAFLQAFMSLYAPGANREQMASLVELQRQATSAGNAIALRRAVDNFDVSETLAKVSVPTIVTHARKDNVHPLDQGRKLAAGIKGAEFVVLESSNHIILPEEQAWDRLHDTIQRFVLA